MNPNSVVLPIRWVGRRGDLDFAPLTIRGHKLAFSCTIPKFLVNSLLLDATFPLNKR